MLISVALIKAKSREMEIKGKLRCCAFSGNVENDEALRKSCKLDGTEWDETIWQGRRRFLMVNREDNMQMKLLLAVFALIGLVAWEN